MEYFDVYPFRNNNPSYMHAIQDEIDMEPLYQRPSEIWPISKRQLLIDSILNDFDLPKIYLHEFLEPQYKDGKRLKFALVDGKQRLAAIFGFMDNSFALASDFKHFRSESTELAGLTFNELSERFPDIVARFVSTSLPVFSIRTGDIEFIEEMFSRLNDGVPLNAPEARNAFGGPAPQAVRDIAATGFFTEKLPFSDSRYRHRDLAAKFLVWEDSWAQGNADKVKDVKKKQLDDFFRDMRQKGQNGVRRTALAKEKSVERLAEMCRTFIDSDPLLQSVGIVSVFYILMQDRQLLGDPFPSREHLVMFEKKRKEDLAVGDEVLTRGHIALLEFNRLAQSPNDNKALVYRFMVLDLYTRALVSRTDPLEAIGPLAPEETSKDGR
ncbi:MAG: DUF262 domain-containing protein [Rhodoglobus sp.]